METRKYELMFVASPDLEDEALDNTLQRVQRYLEAADANIASFKSWGMRRLAYTLRGKRDGRYYVVHFTANPQAISELDHDLRLVDGVLRHLITRFEGPDAPEENADSEPDADQNAPTEETE